MKKSSKKVLALMAAFAIMLTSLSGCGGDTASESSAQESTGESTTFPTMSIQLYHVNPTSEDDQYQKFATLFAEKVGEATGGAITFDIIGNSNENDVLTGFSIGTHEMGIITNGTFSALYGPSTIAELPFFFKDNQTAWEFLDGEIMKEITDNLYTELNTKVLGWAEGGFRNILSQKPIREPADLVGMKIRIPEFDTFMSTFEALGANPTPMAFSEVFTAVQQGVIDGLELPVASAYTGSYYEACDYYNLTGHFYNGFALSCSATFWEGLSPELQEVFSTAALEAGQEQREWLKEASDVMLNEMEEAGCEIVRDVDVAAFQEAVQPVYEMYRDVIGSDLLDRALASVQ